MLYENSSIFHTSMEELELEHTNELCTTFTAIELALYCALGGLECLARNIPVENSDWFQ